jgi:hypothetical protein
MVAFHLARNLREVGRIVKQLFSACNRKRFRLGCVNEFKESIRGGAGAAWTGREKDDEHGGAGAA